MRRQKSQVAPPPAGERIGYARVSTREQHLDLQLDALRKAGCLNIHEEKVSASAKQRPMLDLAIKDLRPGDTLVVWRLDRLARSMRELYSRLDAIAANGAGLLSLNEHLDFSSATGRLMLHIFGALAEFERQLTIERTKAGLAAARERGKRLGQPKSMTPAKIERAQKMLKQRPRPTNVSIARKLGVSITTFQSWTNKRPPVGRAAARSLRSSGGYRLQQTAYANRRAPTKWTIDRVLHLSLASLFILSAGLPPSSQEP